MKTGTIPYRDILKMHGIQVNKYLVCINMKSLLDTLCLVACTLVPFFTTTETNGTFLAAVSPLTGSEHYYFTMNQAAKNDKLNLQQRLKISQARRNRICEAIMGSNFFYMRNVEVVDPNWKAIQADLAQHQPKTYKRLYHRENSSKEIQFVNTFVQYPVIVSSHTVQEHVFSCLARNRITGDTEEYFVSSKYDGNKLAAASQPADKMKGYFVFSRKGEDIKHLEVIALAEKPCRVATWDERMTHVHYDESSFTIKNTICNLTSFENVRLCALVLGTKLFGHFRRRYSYRFLPAEENVDPKCIFRNTPYYTPMCSETWESDEVPIWYIGCKVEYNQEEGTKIVYVARGAAPNSFYACSHAPCHDLTRIEQVHRSTS